MAKDQITGHTKLVCLIGKPTGHSMSPAMHNAAFEKIGVDAVYLSQDVEPENLETALEGLKALGNVAGCNVTMPLKRAIIPLLDGVSDAAELIDAVNVVKIEDGKAYGDNSDGFGFMTNLIKAGFNPEGATMTLLGPGGAGSAILVQAALSGVKTIHLFARANGASYKTAEELIPRVIERTGCDIQLHEMEDLDTMKACIDESDVLANATNVGMGEGDEDKSPVPAEFLRGDMMVADVIYFPRETKLLADAKACGCKTLNGLGMLLYQAAAGEKAWFDVEMPVDYIKETMFAD